MLTPVTPNPIATSTTIKSHGSESRSASVHSQIETQPLPQQSGHSHGIGLDAGTILANVNAEAATAGNRTILQTLALAVAAQLNIVRRNDETMEAFFLRIAAALDDMAPDERAATEARAGLKLLKITLPELSAALKQPDSALAARLSAMAEAPLATPQKTAATATTTYLQDAPGVSRAAETLAMVTQARTNSDGKSLFSSTVPLPEPEQHAGDARSLQTQLMALFEPGIAETRKEIAAKAEPPKALFLGALVDAPPDAANAEAPAAAQRAADAEVPVAAEQTADPELAADEQPIQAADDRQADAEPALAKRTEAKPAEARLIDTRPAEAKPVDAKVANAVAAESKVAIETAVRAEETEAASLARPAADPVDRRAEPRLPGMPAAPANNNSTTLSMHIRSLARELAQGHLQGNPNASPNLSAHADADDHRMQTMLTLKGIAEVITAMPAKAAEFMMSPQRVADIKATEARNAAFAANLPAEAASSADIELGKAEAAIARDAEPARHSSPAPVPVNREADEPRLAAPRHAEAADPQQATRSVDPEKAVLVRAAAAGLDPVPFAYASLQPAKEEFRAEAPEEKARHQDEDEDNADQEPEDEEARRERLARKATDDLLRPEPEADAELKITRDSSQADRAYALYQRMAGF